MKQGFYKDIWKLGGLTLLVLGMLSGCTTAPLQETESPSDIGTTPYREEVTFGTQAEEVITTAPEVVSPIPAETEPVEVAVEAPPIVVDRYADVEPEPPVCSNLVDVEVAHGMVWSYPDWFFGELEDADGSMTFRDLFYYNPSRSIRYIPDVMMNDESGCIRQAEALMDIPVPEMVLDNVDCLRLREIKGKSLLVSLDGARLYPVYVEPNGKYMVIDGVTYDMQNTWEWCCSMLGDEPEWRRVAPAFRHIYLVDMDTTDAYIEVVSRTQYKTVILRYEMGKGLYQVAALRDFMPYTWTFPGNGNGTIYTIASIDHGIETGCFRFELTLQDGILYQLPAGDELQLVLHSAEYRKDYNLRTVESLTLYTEPSVQAEKVSLTPQEVDCLKVLPVEPVSSDDQYPEWILVQGREDGVTGWIYGEDAYEMSFAFAGVLRAD